ncbi:MAG: formylmethanofuran dehydrogenase subunit C [Methylotetracoccus sp.]
MSRLILRLKSDPVQRLDVSSLTPERLAGLSAEEIRGMLLQCGNRQLPVRELFDVSVPESWDTLRFDGGSARFDYLGRGLTLGTIEVAGSAGAYVGHGMRGGTIDVAGDVGIFCGAEMRGGTVTVRGSAGDFLGAALPGNKKGMSGGSVVIFGDAGDRVGDSMRRGLILIKGDAGAYLGSRMTAGTIVAEGSVGPYPGYGMKRGTLLLFRVPHTLMPTFNDCGRHTLGFMTLLLNSLRRLDPSVTIPAGGVLPVRRYAGDFAAQGKGEILVLD